MLNYFDVIKAQSGIPVDDIWTQLWGNTMSTEYVITTYTGTLPITILSAGEDLIDYRIYGNTENGESVGVRTENLFDKSDVEQNCYYNADNVKSINEAHNESDYIPVEAGKVYTLYLKKIKGGFGTVVNLYDTSRAFYKNVLSVIHANGYYSVTPDIDGYIRFNETPLYATDYMFYEGSTAPTSYIPYGYKLPMVSRTENSLIATPIYIGSDPLAEDEYVDFGEQKIYRMVNGTLTPTDPPVPIPALPTIKGETVIDYDGAPKPSQMYIKYKKRR